MSTVPDYDSDNIFAKILRGDMPSHKVYEDAETFAFMDIMPRADGHCLVIPKTAARNVFDASTQQMAACMATVQRIAKAARVAFAADGVTIQQFNERAGGQVVFHLHYHVLPRHEGVGLKPHTGQIEKPEVLSANADKLRAALGKL
jgi:histidine triad (HIT) family protein